MGCPWGRAHQTHTVSGQPGVPGVVHEDEPVKHTQSLAYLVSLGLSLGKSPSNTQSLAYLVSLGLSLGKSPSNTQSLVYLVSLGKGPSKTHTLWLASAHG